MIPRAHSIGRNFRPYTGEVGCFVSVEPDVDTQMKLLDWANRLGFELDPLEEARLHCTVIHSKDGAPLSYTIDPTTRFVARLRGFEFWEGYDNAGYLVATLQSTDLVERHHSWAAAGADHSYGSYTPHVTLKRFIGATDAMYQRMRKLADRERGSILSFYNEQIEDVKVV
jgi:2'-5' RNA ligase